MEFPEKIVLAGVDYALVDVQREKVSAIYRGGDEYVRIGERAKITADLDAHTQMEAAGFPVAKLLGEGTHGEWLYFREASLGEECFGQLFAREYSAQSAISAMTWERFENLSEQFGSAQLGTARSVGSPDDFARGVHLDIACEEEPTHAALFREAFAVASERLSVFPPVVTHGDLTPFNMYPGGVIDLEDSFLAPAGFDLVALVEHLEWFPETSDDQLHQLYRFSDLQRGAFLARIDRLFEEKQLSAPSTYARECSFAKGIWFAVRLDRYPNLRAFRYAHLVSEAEKLLVSQGRKS